MSARYTPGNTEELAETLRRCGRDKQTMALAGGNTKAGLGTPVKVDATISTLGMARILEYAPSDMVIAAEAGVTLDALQAACRKERQQLALDPPFADRATVGGVVATNDFGPRRARYGGVRDLIIGVSLVRVDGAVAKSGGKVVKNVAGFDLPKVVCGSLGTLAAIATATFRLHPLPEASATAVAQVKSAQGVTDLVMKLREVQLEPSSTVALRSGPGSWELLVRFEGFGKGVAEQCARLQKLTPCEVLSEGAAEAAWAKHGRVRTEGAVRLKMASLPGRLASIEPHLAALGGQFAWYAPLGIGFLSAPDADPAAINAARATLVSHGGSLVVHELPQALRASVDPWGPRPASFAQMERLKNNFDPERRLNPGRYVGGL